MTLDLASIAGCLLVCAICTWAVVFLVSQLRSRSETGKAIDRTLSEVEREDAPGLFGLQALGFILLIGTSAALGVGAVVVLVEKMLNH